MAMQTEVTIHMALTITVVTTDKDAAIAEAKQLVDGLSPQEGFVDGWNGEVLKQGRPLIGSYGEIEVVDLDTREVGVE